jgi:phage portal protein BeeE
MAEMKSESLQEAVLGDEIETRGSYVGAMIRERKLTDRLLDAMNSLRSDKAAFTSLGVADIRIERKSKLETPDLGQYNYTPTPYRTNYWRRNDRVNHKSEVGDLDLNSLAMAVVNFTATRIPEAKPCVVTREGTDEKRDFNHPMAQLIRRPNGHHIWANYAGACSVSWWLNGNVFFYKTRSLTEVEELWYLPHFLVQPRWPGDGKSPDVVKWAEQHGESTTDLDTFLSHYQYNPPGKAPVLYPAKDILHLKRHVDLSNPRLGIGPFEALYKELCADDKMALFTAAIFANMGIQVPVISPADNADTIDDAEAAHMKESWMQKTTGSRAGEPVIMTAPIKVEKFGFSPTELNVSDLRLIIEARVCAVCNISPAALQLMVGIQNGTSYASSEQARQQGYEEVIIPIQNVWAEEFNWQLKPEYDDMKNSEFEFDVSKVRVLQEDTDALFKREVEVFKSGGTTYDQFLVSVGKPPVGGPLGEVRLVPGLSNPMTPDQLIGKADGSLAPEPAPQQIDPASLAKFADMERMFADLERQMKGFEVGK